MQRHIQGAIVNLYRAVGGRANPLHHVVAVEWGARQGRQDEHVEGALQEVHAFMASVCLVNSIASDGEGKTNVGPEDGAAGPRTGCWPADGLLARRRAAGPRTGWAEDGLLSR